MFDEILAIFRESNIRIKSLNYLIEYIKFCLNNDEGCKKVNSKNYSLTSYHHILPSALFPNYKKLSENSWCGAHLTFYNHYYAHWLLANALNEYSQTHAFICMHIRDVKNGRIAKSELISKEEVNFLMCKRATLQLEFESRIINTEFGVMTNKEYASKKASILKQSLNWKNSIGKEQVTKFIKTVLTPKLDEAGKETSLSKEIAKKSATTMRKIFLDEDSNETTIYKLASKKCAETKSKIFLDEDGKETNIYKESGKKLSHKLNLTFIDINGIETTLAKERGKSCSKTKNKIVFGVCGAEITLAKLHNRKALETKSKIFLDGDGKETNIDKESGKKLSEKYRRTAKKYVVKNAITREIYAENMTPLDIRNLSGNLFYKTNEKYLGFDKKSSAQLKNSGREHLIGLYVVKY